MRKCDVPPDLLPLFRLVREERWWLRDEIVWAKPNPMPSSVTDRTTPAHEMVYLLTRSARYAYDADAVREPHAFPNVAHISTRQHEGIAEAFMGNPPTNIGRAGNHEAGRNKRSVWTVATQPYPEAHFATFPEALIEPMILAGCPERVCADCGAPWERVVERETTLTRPGTASKLGLTERERRDAGRDITVGLQFRPETRVTTTGWRPTCAHDAVPVPGVTLDPFGGSGTVAVVAQRLGRKSVLIDLSAEYVGQMIERIGRARGSGDGPAVDMPVAFRDDGLWSA